MLPLQFSGGPDGAKWRREECGEGKKKIVPLLFPSRGKKERFAGKGGQVFAPKTDEKQSFWGLFFGPTTRERSPVEEEERDKFVIPEKRREKRSHVWQRSLLYRREEEEEEEERREGCWDDKKIRRQKGGAGI